MYHAWLDRWDERRAQRGEQSKEVSEFALGTELAFPEARGQDDLRSLCEVAEDAVKNPEFFNNPVKPPWSYRLADRWVEFPSSVSTETEQNRFL